MQRRDVCASGFYWIRYGKLSGLLPAGKYKKYDVEKNPRGKKRIVVEFFKKVAYYTRDHYETYTKMKWPR